MLARRKFLTRGKSVAPNAARNRNENSSMAMRAVCHATGIDVLAGQHAQQLEHLNPFVDAVQEAEDGQGAQAVPQARIRAAIGFQRDGQAHREKREAVDEEDQHHVVLRAHQWPPLCTVISLIVAQQRAGEVLSVALLSMSNVLKNEPPRRLASGRFASIHEQL